MRHRLNGLVRGAALLALLVGLFLPGVGFAGPALDDDDDGRNNRDVEREIERSAREDRELDGQVVDINTLRNPPEMRVATVDGIVRVRLLTTDLIQKNGVRTGDHVTLVGEKISEVEFDCQELRVDGHVGDSLDNDNSD